MTHTFALLDDGTMDTVIDAYCADCEHGEEMRFNPEPPEDGDSEDWDRVDEAIGMAELDFCCHCDDD